jgi:hypothetical protein
MAWDGFQRLGQLGRDIGGRLTQWDNTYKPLEDARIPRDVSSTGSNLRDIGIGLLSGIAQAGNRKEQYMPIFNYAGNGLARIGGDMVSNNNYINPNSIGRIKASLLMRPRRKISLPNLNQQQSPQEEPQMNNFNPDISSRYPLPTSTNRYLEPGLYDDGRKFNPFKFTRIGEY